MTTKTFHDIYDIVELIQMLENASIDIHIHNGQMFFDITHFTKGADGLTEDAETLLVDGDSTVQGYFENIDKAYRLLEEKIASGEWVKNDDCA